ncbi:TIGR04282 family arsenosugar biosynthesis glycosyltransferase [Zunongwangia sp. HGR-M22]|uniref:TIGR04282 family arsenosugar biosynthesis glycosyltransferase n=1 Tax=Zunongwangia sp. HGR-M22 TaxID=3015168 RepID=UPI0022DDBA0F|nr:TIGR04282 family arsenosugar biosynthesis glycosyltransferase [Zunongwangia sp. HGR-M22]WBL25237.1 TIGR04282 family arsenosugar biosynthesis glycosyltransferase [Zunongwangia sp. HGR-M22]
MREKTTSKNLLIIFTRNPEFGKVKTRLAKDVGDQTALEIYRFLLDHTVKVTAPISAEKRVYYSEEIQEGDIWNPNIFQKKKQYGKDLGERMKYAFTEGFEDGYEKIAIIGSDLFDINSEDLEKAFEALETQEVVIGPAQDGGYYLLGMRQLKEDLFENKFWGTDTVLKETIQNLTNTNYKLLEERNDVDYYSDIQDHPAFSQFFTK